MTKVPLESIDDVITGVANVAKLVSSTGMLPEPAESAVPAILTLAAIAHDLIAAGDDSAKQLAALLDAADAFADDIERRKFG